jgi:acetyltransferase-like isoleucine patch superfamily enzyme
MKHCVIKDDVTMGRNVQIYSFVNLYGCTIGDDATIGTFVEIQADATIGKGCKISSHTFICSGVTIGHGCFIGHGVVFINDNYPRSLDDRGEREGPEDWSDRYVPTTVGNNVSIGSNATILGGITIGDAALIGAGAVVTKDVPGGTTAVGNPARLIGSQGIDQ